jgi:hypothetical protein
MLTQLARARQCEILGLEMETVKSSAAPRCIPLIRLQKTTKSFMMNQSWSPTVVAYDPNQGGMSTGGYTFRTDESAPKDDIVKSPVEYASEPAADEVYALQVLSRCLRYCLASISLLAVVAVGLSSHGSDRFEGVALTVATISVPGPALAGECEGAHASHDAHGCCSAFSTCSPCLPIASSQDVETPQQAGLAIAAAPPQAGTCVGPGLRPPKLVVRA